MLSFFINKIAKYWYFLLISTSLFIISELFINLILYLHILFGKKSHYISSLCVWDCLWYKSIVDTGYLSSFTSISASQQVNWAFFPLLPFLSKCLVVIFQIESTTSLIIISKFFLFLSIFVFIYFISLHYSEINISPWIPGILVALNPYSIYGHSGYSESVYFFFLTLSLIFLKRRSFILAGMSAAFLTSSRLFGIFIIYIFIEQIILYYKQEKHNRPMFTSILIGISLVPIGLFIFMLHLYLKTGDPFSFLKAQAAWGHHFKGPFRVIYEGWQRGGFYSSFSLIATFSFFSLYTLIHKKKWGYFLYLSSVLILPLSSTLLSFPRFLFWQPIFLLVLVFSMQKKIVRNISLPILIIINMYIIHSWFLVRMFVT